MEIDLAPVEPWRFVELRAEPENPVDPNAVLVLYEGRPIGYLPASIAARMDDPSDWQAVVSHVFVVDEVKAGVRLLVGRLDRAALEARARGLRDAGLVKRLSKWTRDWDDGYGYGGY